MTGALSFLWAAREVPNRVAVVHDGVEHTYSGLSPRVARLTDNLLRLGPADGVTAVPGTTTLSTLLSLYAAMELGRAVLPLHPRHSDRQRKDLFARVDPAFSLTEAEIGRLSAEDRGKPAALSDRPPIDDARDLALLETSATRGPSKAVRLSRLAFIASARASEQNLGWQADDRWLLALPVAHVGGFSIVTRCLIARRPVVIVSGPSFDAQAISLTLKEQRVTLASLVPAQLAKLLELREPPPASLRAVLIGGSSISTHLFREAIDRGWPVLKTYGLTEACSQVTCQRYAHGRDDGGSGPPLSGIDVRLVDGCIQVRGPTLFSGYLPPSADGGASLTADGWLETRDTGCFDERGCLHVTGRLDDIIVSGGENVQPTEVEAMLEQIDGVRAAVVFGLPDETWGQKVAAAIVTDDGFEYAAFVRRLQSELSSFRRPRAVAWLKELPESPSGKLARPALAERLKNQLVPIE